MPKTSGPIRAEASDVEVIQAGLALEDYLKERGATPGVRGLFRRGRHVDAVWGLFPHEWDAIVTDRIVSGIIRIALTGLERVPEVEAILDPGGGGDTGLLRRAREAAQKEGRPLRLTIVGCGINDPGPDGGPCPGGRRELRADDAGRKRGLRSEPRPRGQSRGHPAVSGHRAPTTPTSSAPGLRRQTPTSSSSPPARPAATSALSDAEATLTLLNVLLKLGPEVPVLGELFLLESVERLPSTDPRLLALSVLRAVSGAVALTHLRSRALAAPAAIARGRRPGQLTSRRPNRTDSISPMAAIELQRRGEALRPDHGGRRPRPRRARGHLPRPARPQRRRQVDDDAAADRAGDRPTPASCACSATSCPPSRRSARAEMGVVPQLDNLDVDVTVEDNLAVFARLYRVPDVGAAVDRALDLARLQRPPPRRRRRALRRDAPAPAAGPRPRPRPEAGPARRADRRPRPADPHRALDADRRACARSGTTILMSTHYIEEAERLADEVAVMAQGKIISRGRPGRADRRARRPRDRRGLRPAANGWPRPRARAEAAGCGCARPGRRSRSSAPSGPPTAPSPRTPSVRAASLEDVFVLLTGEEAE